MLAIWWCQVSNCHLNFLWFGQSHGSLIAISSYRMTWESSFHHKVSSCSNALHLSAAELIVLSSAVVITLFCKGMWQVDVLAWSIWHDNLLSGLSVGVMEWRGWSVDGSDSHNGPSGHEIWILVQKVDHVTMLLRFIGASSSSSSATPCSTST